MKHLNKDFKLDVNQAIEFQNVLVALYGQNNFYKFLEEDNIKFDCLVDKYIEKMKKKLTLYMKWELNYFFNMGEFTLYSMGRMIYMKYILNHSPIKKVEELIRIIENSDSIIFAKAIFLCHMYINKSRINFKKVEKEVNSISEMIEIIKNTTYQFEDTKVKIIECLENLEETKQRYCLLLNNIYQKIYKTYEEDILKLVIKKKTKYEDRFNRDPEQFCKDCFNTDLEVFGNKVCIHISFFWNIGYEYWPKQFGEEVIILGANSHLKDITIPQKEKIFNFLKTISDKSRLEIIHLLSERPYYVNELAEKLNFSTATISYHLSKLQEINIVDFKRRDQRFYYFLLDNQIKNLFKEASELFVE
ncbi:winged helix-turn-helix transcriptional regulator [Mycoplasmatota bacterium]|nr:winged helix-turn-helix transcriptional regulator [Mycoplasmatota bacterium]